MGICESENNKEKKISSIQNQKVLPNTTDYIKFENLKIY